VKYLQELLKQIGLDAGRVKMVNLSAAMGVQFAQYAQEFSEEIIKIGPNPLNIAPEEAAI